MFRYGGDIRGGGYGTIFQAFRNDTAYAVKCFGFEMKKCKCVGAVWIREVDFLRRCDHPAILSLVQVIHDDSFLATIPSRFGVFDRVQAVTPKASSSLFHHIIDMVDKNTVNPAIYKRMMYQIAQAVEYLHSQDIIHRDIKSANILIFADEEVPNARLCDFGMAKHLNADELNSVHVSTSSYKPPELVMGKMDYDKSFDIWCLGILFFEIINGKVPYGTTNAKKRVSDVVVIEEIFESRGSPDRDLYNYLTDGSSSIISFQKLQGWEKKSLKERFNREHLAWQRFDDQLDHIQNFGTEEQYCQLLESMIEVDPRKRLTATQVLQDDFFEKVPMEDEDGWFDLKVQKLPTPKYHKLQKVTNSELRKQGTDFLAKIPTKVENNEDYVINYWKILFQALDLYDRSLLALQGQEAEPEGVGIDAELLACCCAYISCKYYLDEGTPQFREIFPFYKLEEVEKLLELEQKILVEICDWRVYRVTIFDLLEKKLSPITLFDIMCRKEIFYNSKPINILAKMYLDAVK